MAALPEEGMAPSPAPAGSVQGHVLSMSQGTENTTVSSPNYRTAGGQIGTYKHTCADAANANAAVGGHSRNGATPELAVNTSVRDT